MYSILSHIHNPNDLKKISQEDLAQLAAEARDFILDIVSTKSGHLGASLGVVELTIALHYHYDTPADILIWDVGHQAYVHKLLTGRKPDFDTLRQWKGMSGFPTREESVYDAFGVGHSSTSISAITGMALANKLKKKSNKHIAVIGDASIVSGMAFEGLNHLGATDLDVLIILNDNNIGIDPAVGALQKHFNNVEDFTQADFFRSLGFYYEGVVDGHDFDAIFNAFKKLDKIHKPKLLHLRTIKGKGYDLAEKDQILWHSPGKFDKKTGEIQKINTKTTFQQVVGKKLNTIFAKNSNTVAITPAMPTGSGLVELMQNYPDRVWDVGIAEQHAVTLSAGLATQGIIPFCVVYSTFLQRAYDQVIHDVALQNLPVIFLIDRAGLVGTDGATHHGYFDISFFNAIPNIAIACPADKRELEELIDLALEHKSPIAIRYPKGEIMETDLFNLPTKFGQAKHIKRGENTVVLTTGDMAQTLQIVINNSEIGWFHFPFVKPLDNKCLDRIFDKYSRIITFENGMKNGGFGQSVLNYANVKNYDGCIEIYGYPDAFVSHGNMTDLNISVGLDIKAIEKLLLENDSASKLKKQD